MSNINARNKFIQDLQVPNNTPNNALRFSNNPNRQNNIYDPHRRNVRNKPPVPSQKKYKGTMIKKIAGILAGIAILGGGIKIGSNIYENYVNEQYSRDLQSEIEVAVKEEIKNNIDRLNITFDGNNFNVACGCDRKELYNVLASTDLDELLNTYLSNPTDIEKEKLLSELEGREEDIAKFNMDLIEASFADSENTSINNIDIKAIFKHYNAENGDRIVNGEDIYMGHTLYIHTTKANVEARAGRTSDFTQIPSDIFQLISDTRFQLKAPNSSYFENPIKDTKRSALDISIQTYKKIKKIINDRNFAIKDGKVTTVEIAKSQSQINEKDNELEH